MADTKRILSKQSFTNIFQTYSLTNKLPFIVNLLEYLVLIKNNSFKTDAGYKYRIYFYRYIFSIQYNTSKTIWDRVLYLFIRHASYNLDFTDIHIFTNPINTQTLNRLIDSIEYLLYTYRDTSLQNVQDFPSIFSITRDSNSNTYINGQLVVDGNIRVTLYKLSASALKTIISNSILFTNITNDNIIDPTTTPDDDTECSSSQIDTLITQLASLTTNYNNLDTRLTNLQNGLLINDQGDTSQLSAIQALQTSKANVSTTINGYRLDSNINLTKSDIDLGNIDNTSDIAKPVSLPQQTALDTKVDKSTTINGIPLNTSNITIPISSLGLNNIDNTSDMNKPISIATQNALNLKVDKTITVNGYNLNSNVILHPIDIGLENVDNTSDLAKPVSLLQQALADTKADKSITINGNSISSNIILGKSDVGLGNVDNTNDLSKPISTAQQLAFDFKADKSITINSFPLSANINLDKNNIGLSNVDNTTDLSKPISTAQQLALNTKVDISSTINGYNFNSGNINLTKFDIGLSNIDNTSDLSKPISIQQQQLFDTKSDKTITINTYPLSSNINLTKSDIGLSNVDNTADIDKPISNPQQLKLDIVNNSLLVLTDLVSSKANNFVSINGYPIVSNINLTKQDIGLSNVDNTSDLTKPVSFAQQSLVDSKESIINKNQPNGYVGLDSNGRISLSQMPSVIGSTLIYMGTWNALTNTPTLSSGIGSNGQYYKVSVAGSTSIDGINSWNIGDWIIYNGTNWQQTSNSENVQTVNGRVGNVIITKTDLGLTNIDNTSDINKPISSQQQTAFDLKINKLISFTTGNIPMITLDGSLTDSNHIINDNLNSSSSILWSSNKIELEINNKTQQQLPDFYFNNYSFDKLANYFNKSSECKLFSFNSIPSVSGSQPFSGSIYSPYEDRIYFVPYNTTDLYYFDCITSQFHSLLISNLVSNAYIGGAYLPSLNRIYFAPYSQSSILHYIDCNTGTVVEYSGNQLGIQYFGAIYSPKQNFIFFIGHSISTSWMYIDGSDGSIQSFNHGFTFPSSAFTSGVYSPTSNRIYLVPYAQSSNWYYIDCNTNIIQSYLSNVSIVNQAYMGGVYCPNNDYIYFIPHLQQNGLHYINKDGIVQSLSFSNTTQYAGGVYINNRIILIPYETGLLQNIDINTNQISSLGTIQNGCFGGCFSPTNNSIILSPFNQSNWYYIKFLDNPNVSKSIMANALFNKF